MSSEVIGQPVSFAERAGGAGGLVRLALHPVLIGGIGWWIAARAHDGFDAHALGFLGLGAVALVSAALLLMRLFDLLNYTALRCACPSCGQERVRRFTELMPVECGACLAYLAAEGRTVREVAPDAVDDWPCFEVSEEALARLAEVRFPDGCALCGEPAREHQEVDHFDAARASQAVERVGAIFPEGHSHAYNLSVGTRGSPAVGGEEGDAMRLRLKYPMCGRKQCDAEYYAVADVPSGLAFRSYRYYRAFCALNKVGE